MENFHPTGNCPVRDVLSRLGDKWSMLVLITLNANGVMRFSDIHKTIEDVSQRMLTVTLRTLEADGLVARKIYARVPPRGGICLTKTGHSLIPHIEALVGLGVGEHACHFEKTEKLNHKTTIMKTEKRKNAVRRNIDFTVTELLPRLAQSKTTAKRICYN